MESILNDIKKLLGIDPEYTVFDTDIIIHINSVFMILNQLGVGPDGGYKIVDSSNTWTEFTQDNLLLESVKSYIYLKVRMMFDPPQNSAYMNAIQSQIQELEWRLNVASSEV
jgi:hypothetical protein